MEIMIAVSFFIFVFFFFVFKKFAKTVFYPVLASFVIASLFFALIISLRCISEIEKMAKTWTGTEIMAE